MGLFRSREEKALQAALSRHGAAGPWVSAAAAWEGFKEYARGLDLSEGTGLLFQVGTHSFGGRPLFYFNPVCQFQLLDADGEFEAFKQLQCELTCPPTPALEGVETNLWSFDFQGADAFFAAVEALPEFQRVVAQGNYRLQVSYGLV
jgi:hypothetical protein